MRRWRKNEKGSALPFHLDLACTDGYDPDEAILTRGMPEAPAEVELHRETTEAVMDILMQ